ncbi:MAG: PLP-dependent aspartate aminotransferase family protein [Candidatus Eisenbacteria bacterium]|uniref:PLP-dependent aspartate aminotransferase family protein n=1 Tax=Eiseniibacteriota bacterium TaxID=2212470 RepID=A0A948RYK6_UNCEI|nr:PLP-dependent aspartate aminotransferase family protein [Candidatus Eisenbacteria bacterium]MBU1947416.1 PLP-dependent aspartate aminotransferase family protein [Candidatus Eisenbacteria bacterium]MBU2693395.1 PLP-dependent aspartate aminotransferase family protein [Candidatus Eisenbacteria bacterium]
MSVDGSSSKNDPKKLPPEPAYDRHPKIQVGQHNVGLSSFLIHGRFRTAKWDYTHHVVPPISSSSTFRLESSARGAEGFVGFADPATHRHTRRSVLIYERLDEPARAMLEDQIAMAEGGQLAVAFSSGMAAVSGALGTILSSGHEVIAHKTLYGCTYSFLTTWMPRWRIGTQFIDLTDTNRLAAAITPATRCIYFETPVNPTLDLIDLQATVDCVAEENKTRALEDKIRIVVDNTFASPYGQRPLSFGVDVVLHSLTKNLCGFGTEMGGVVILPSEELEGDLLMFRKDFGGALSAKTAWSILVHGLPTLEIRMDREQSSALQIARYLEEHPLVERVIYPGLESFPQGALARKQMLTPNGKFAPGVMIYFILKGDEEVRQRLSDLFVDHLATHAYTITLAVSLGQIRTLVEKPSTMTHAAVPVECQKGASIDPGGVRLSVGLEDPQDILNDLDDGFTAIRKEAAARGIIT